MLKLFDWKCRSCGATIEHVIDVAAKMLAPRTMRSSCRSCRKRTTHERLMSAPAPYTGEKVYCPRVYGGKFDTMGYRSGPKLPEIKDGENLRDYARANKEILRERREVFKGNTEKRKRANALAKGGRVNFRRDKCRADPKGI
jgi:hypothetical protein